MNEDQYRFPVFNSLLTKANNADSSINNQCVKTYKRDARKGTSGNH